MDEPFSNLDAALRVQLRDEVARMVRGRGRPSVFVTHDRAEAFALGDRIAVMADGRIGQIGTPEDLYARPSLPGWRRSSGTARSSSATATGTCATTPIGRLTLSDAAPSGRVQVLVRPEQVAVVGSPTGSARVVACEYRGSVSELEIALGGVVVQATVLGTPDVGCGDTVDVSIVGRCPAFAAG